MFVLRTTRAQRSNKELRTQNEALFTQRDSALAQLNVLVEEKKAMESDLYNKVLARTSNCKLRPNATRPRHQLTPRHMCGVQFVQILNEKKKKIRELKRQGKAFPRSLIGWSQQVTSDNGMRCVGNDDDDRTKRGGQLERRGGLAVAAIDCRINTQRQHCSRAQDFRTGGRRG